MTIKSTLKPGLKPDASAKTKVLKPKLI